METPKYVTNHFKNIRFIYYALTSIIKYHSQYINLKMAYIVYMVDSILKHKWKSINYSIPNINKSVMLKITIKISYFILI